MKNREVFGVGEMIKMYFNCIVKFFVGEKNWDKYY